MALFNVYRPVPEGASEDGSAQLGRQSREEGALGCRPIVHTSHTMYFRAKDAACDDFAGYRAATDLKCSVVRSWGGTPA